MSVGPFGAPSGSPGPTVQSLGAAPAAPSASSGLTTWTPPASQRYLRPPPAESPSFATSAPTPAANVPSLARRLTIGSLRLVPLLVFYVVIPDLGLQSLQAHGIASGLPFGAVTVFGAVLAVISTVAYVARPTRAYGPLATVSSLGKVVYLLYFAAFATISITISSIGVQLEFGDLLRLLAIVPAFGVVAGLLTTVEDVRRPGERIPLDYPA